jgi:hypothetical protein
MLGQIHGAICGCAKQKSAPKGADFDLSGCVLGFTEKAEAAEFHLLASGTFRYLQPTLRSFSRLAGVFPERDAATASAKA